MIFTRHTSQMHKTCRIRSIPLAYAMERIFRFGFSANDKNIILIFWCARGLDCMQMHNRQMPHERLNVQSYTASHQGFPFERETLNKRADKGTAECDECSIAPCTTIFLHKTLQRTSQTIGGSSDGRDSDGGTNNKTNFFCVFFLSFFWSVVELGALSCTCFVHVRCVSSFISLPNTNHFDSSQMAKQNVTCSNCCMCNCDNDFAFFTCS